MAKIATKTPQARRDLIELADYIARDDFEASERFLDAAEAAFQLLAGEPGLGTLCDFRSVDAVGVRVWSIRGFENYLVFYRAIPAGIDVIRVIHGARDLRAVFGEERS